MGNCNLIKKRAKTNKKTCIGKTQPKCIIIKTPFDFISKWIHKRFIYI